MLPTVKLFWNPPLFFGIFIGIALGWWYFVVSNKQTLAQTDSSQITCLILLKSQIHKSLNVSKATWIPKCDNYLIVKPYKRRRNMYSANEDAETCHRPVCDEVSVSADNSWTVLCHALRLLPRPINWLLIVPDTSLVVLENLRRFVSGKDWRAAWYLGHSIEHYVANYNTLSAGIVLSNGSVEALLKMFPDEKACETSGNYWNKEDLYLGIHLKEAGVDVADTRDALGKTRFHGFNVHTLLFPGKIFKQTDYFKKSLYPIREGIDCCSEDLITIDASDADRALFQYFLLYGVGRTGLPPQDVSIPDTGTEPTWVTALREIGYTGPTDGITSQEYYDIWAKYLPPEKLIEKLAETVKS